MRGIWRIFPRARRKKKIRFFSPKISPRPRRSFSTAPAPPRRPLPPPIRRWREHRRVGSQPARMTPRVLVDALGRADILNRADSKAADREKVRAALAAINSPQTAVAGLTGRLYFNADRDIPRPVRLGYFHHGRFVTAPLQLVRVDSADALDLAAEREKGQVASFGDRHYWVQRVVYTGIDIVRLNRIDVKQGTFNVDFYLWMRFATDGDGQTQVQFPALLDRGAFDTARSLQTGEEDGLNYRLYRINGDFKARYELRDYPFDTQQLLLHFQNTEQRQELVT